MLGFTPSALQIQQQLVQVQLLAENTTAVATITLTARAGATMAVFIQETDYPSRRTLASLFSASDNSSEYKYG